MTHQFKPTWRFCFHRLQILKYVGIGWRISVHYVWQTLCVFLLRFQCCISLFGVHPQLRAERTGKCVVGLGFCHTVINNQPAPQRNTTITADTSLFEWKDHVLRFTQSVSPPLALFFPTMPLLQTVLFTICHWLSQWCWLKIIYIIFPFSVPSAENEIILGFSEPYRDSI